MGRELSIGQIELEVVLGDTVITYRACQWNVILERERLLWVHIWSNLVHVVQRIEIIVFILLKLLLLHLREHRVVDLGKELKLS